MDASILHADLDAFYASVEQLLQPVLRGRPVAVGGGVVLAASYEARASGSRAACRAAKARELWGGAPSKATTSANTSAWAMRRSRFSRTIRRLSNASRSTRRSPTSRDRAERFGAPAAIAQRVRARVRAELGLPISIGVANTKHLAKIASQVAKPDGPQATSTPPPSAPSSTSMPVELMWESARPRNLRLADAGIETIGQLACRFPGSMERLLGRAAGRKLQALAWNRDPREIQRERRSHSAGAQSALGREPATERVFHPVLRHLADRIARRLRARTALAAP